MSYLPRLALLVLAALFSGQVQAQAPPFDQLEPQAQIIASDDPCATDLGVASPSDNLSCEFIPPGGGTFCYPRDELCNMNPICLTGSDEGANIAALDCTGERAGTNVPVFECTSGENVLLEQLCDGINHCSAGDDEVTPLCENKCRYPYYGGCPFTRECLTSALDVGCPNCLAGFVESPNNPGGQCFALIDIALEFDIYNTAEGLGFVEVCAVVVGRSVEPNAFAPVTAQLDTSPGTATAADFELENPPASLTFTNTQSRDCANILIFDDNENEPTEAFTVILSSTNFRVNIVTDRETAQVFIADNEVLFEFTQNTYIGLESAPGIPFAIRVAQESAVLTESVTVTVTSGSGSAIATVDYTPVIVQLTFPAGSGPLTTLEGLLNPIEDTRVEPNENVQLTAIITAGTGAFTLNGDTATVVIQDNDFLTIGFEPTTYQVTEAMGVIQVCFEVEEDNVLDIAGVARLNTVSGSAIALVDFTPLNNVDSEVALPIGTSLGNQFCTDIEILQDGVPENLESFTVELTSDSPAFVIVNPATNMATVNILGDLIQFQFSEVTYDVSEGDMFAQVCLDLISGVLAADTPFTITPQIGTAGDMDFTNVALPTLFPAGSSVGERRCVNIPLNDDTLVEVPESFSVSADSNDPNVLFTPGRDTATVTITDNDIAQFRYSQTTYVVGESNGPAVPAIELVFGTLTFDIDVDVATVAGGSATAGDDYVAIPTQRLTFPAGSSPNAQMPFNIQIFPDVLVEGDETVNLMANSPSNFAIVDPDSATLVIDDDDLLVLRLEQVNYQVLEPIPGFIEVCYLVEDGELAINLIPALRMFTTDGTATALPAPGDYNGIDMNINLNVGVGQPGLTRFCQNIIINDDQLAEGDEFFTVSLTSLNSLVTINPLFSSAQVQILDEDNIEFEFDELIYDTTEGGVAMVMVCVNLVSGTLVLREVQVDVQPKPYDPALDSAEPILDYAAFSAPLIFPINAIPGQQECFNIQPFIVDDLFVENPESFRIMLSSPDATAQFIAGRDCATINIADNDQVIIVFVPPPGLGVPSYTTPENTPTGSQEICVVIQGAPANVLQRPVTVNLVSSDGQLGVNGAQSPGDYGAINAPIIFNPGQEGQQMCREIPIFDDIICEADEVFNIFLQSNDPAVNLIQPAGTVTIIDNDVASVSADQTEYWVNEQEDLWITLHLDGQKGEGRECVVSVMTVDGTATDGEDYVGIAGTYVFNSTTFTQRIQVDIINERRCEGDETFHIYLNTDSPGCQVATPELYVTIHDDEIGGMGDDPHFSIYLPSGEMLCYTVQGEHGFAFNLISNKQLIMNAKFVPDARREEVTWLGSMGIIIQNSNYGGSNDTRLRFEAQEKSLYINDKVTLSAKNVEKLTFSNGKMTISEAAPMEGFHYPSLLIDLQDVEVSFTIKYTNQHLDMFWHSTGKKVTNSHGIIGQFFRKGVEVDKVRKILIMPDKEPVPVMRRPVWSFMERETRDDQLCWTAMNPGYQGEGLIDGTYLDYLVDDVMSTDFKFKQ